MVSLNGINIAKRHCVCKSCNGDIAKGDTRGWYYGKFYRHMYPAYLCIRCTRTMLSNGLRLVNTGQAGDLHDHSTITWHTARERRRRNMNRTSLSTIFGRRN